MSHHFKPPRIRTTGSTLVELLVVTRVISTIIALLRPALAAVRQEALSVACAVTLRMCAIRRADQRPGK